MEKLPRYLVIALSQEPWYFLYVKRAVTKMKKSTFCYSPFQVCIPERIPQLAIIVQYLIGICNE